MRYQIRKFKLLFQTTLRLVCAEEEAALRPETSTRLQSEPFRAQLDHCGRGAYQYGLGGIGVERRVRAVVEAGQQLQEHRALVRHIGNGVR